MREFQNCKIIDNKNVLSLIIFANFDLKQSENILKMGIYLFLIYSIYLIDYVIDSLDSSRITLVLFS